MLDDNHDGPTTLQLSSPGPFNPANKMNKVSRSRYVEAEDVEVSKEIMLRPG